MNSDGESITLDLDSDLDLDLNLNLDAETKKSNSDRENITLDLDSDLDLDLNLDSDAESSTFEMLKLCVQERDELSLSSKSDSTVMSVAAVNELLDEHLDARPLPSQTCNLLLVWFWFRTHNSLKIVRHGQHHILSHHYNLPHDLLQILHGRATYRLFNSHHPLSKLQFVWQFVSQIERLDRDICRLLRRPIDRYCEFHVIAVRQLQQPIRCFYIGYLYITKSYHSPLAR